MYNVYISYDLWSLLPPSVASRKSTETKNDVLYFVCVSVNSLMKNNAIYQMSVRLTLTSRVNI
jgi:hypothetical protein